MNRSGAEAAVIGGDAARNSETRQLVTGAISLTFCGRVQINILVLPDNDSVISF